MPRIDESRPFLAVNIAVLTISDTRVAADDKSERVRASYGANYEKLAALKRKYDPNNLFKLNPNVPPEG